MAVSNVAATPQSWRLEAVHDLLPVLVAARDVSEICEHLRSMSSRLVRHDEMHLALLNEDGSAFTLYEATGSGSPVVVSSSTSYPPRDLGEAHVAEDIRSDGSAWARVSAPVRIRDQAVGALAFQVRPPQQYTTEDLALLGRLAEYIAIAVSHQRLAESAKQSAAERHRMTTVETSMELLRTIADVLDIRTVFPHVSEIANKMLAHDFLTMSFHDRDGTILIEAASGDDLHGLRRIVKPGRSHPPERFLILDDFAVKSIPVIEPQGFQQLVLQAGFRSLLTVQASARDQEIGLGFWSKKPSAFTLSDVPIARRIADHVTLAVSHEQLATAAKSTAEAHARAERLERRVNALASELEQQPGRGRVIGHSESWLDVLKRATQVAATETTVLLTGESGTGKEVVARFIHRSSTRAGGPFVALNCAALPEQLLESELFGYERGAFTGAQQAKPGQIELASCGVLFLDEVSEMSPSAQAKFLRVLQEREFLRLGGTRQLTANVRVIAATNRDLRQAVTRGAFREDLYYRLQVFDIKLPPLRERPADILPLSDAFLDDIGRTFGRPPAGLTCDARDALLRHGWPGNVRELRNALERAAILCEGGLITTQHLSFEMSPQSGSVLPTDLGAVERATMLRVLQEVHWNKSHAARRLGLTRTQLYVRLRKYQLERPPEESS
jgi:transcriptional regulator with GAF, ATPase, and Fis domain